MVEQEMTRNELERNLKDSAALLAFAWDNYRRCRNELYPHELEDAVAAFRDEIQGIIDEKIMNNEPYDKRAYREYLRQKGVKVEERKGITAEEAKSRSRIEDVVAGYVTLRKAGANLVGLCPFHDEKTGSFTVYPKTQTCHCFGCGEHQDVIGFLMRIEGITFIQAINRLADN